MIFIYMLCGMLISVHVWPDVPLTTLISCKLVLFRSLKSAEMRLLMIKK